MNRLSLGNGTANARTAGLGRPVVNPLPLWGLALAALVAASGGCAKTRACRVGTVFLSVRLGPFSTADRLDVGVSVNGGTAQGSSLPLSGESGGGIEITFPSGYPSGGQLTLQLSLKKDMLPIAARTVLALLSPGCTALEIDFGGGDAGVDVRGGSGGQGTEGIGGLMGGGGVVGAGAGGSQAGETGGGRGGQSDGGIAGGGIPGGGMGGGGTGGGSTGGGGTSGGGTSGGGTGGGGTGGGGTGGGGTGGGGTGGGDPGSGGRGGASDGGSDFGCAPAASAESCYNNIDDDCNGLTDCADPACVPIAQCEPLDATLGMIGASVQTGAACPADAQNTRTLSADLAAAPCGGCSCGAGTATLVCSADIFAYGASASTCGSNTGGDLVATFDSTQGCFTPTWPAPLVYGFRAGGFQGRPTGTCLPIGAPTKGTPVWNATAKFCGVPAVGGGCAAGSACVPRTVVAAGACLLLDGTRTCPASAPRLSAWFTAYSDTRTCGACSCGSPTGGNCGPMIIAVGSNSVCSDAAIEGYLRDGDRLCVGGSGVSSPGLQFTGTPVAPTCAPLAASSGTLTATGPQTLCCM